MLPYLILGVTYAFAAVVQPGQFQAYVLSQALANGWRRTLPVGLAPILSDIPIVSLVLFVLTSVPPIFVQVLQLAGGLFLLHLAWSAAKACRDYQQVQAAPPASARKTVLNAAIVNLLNPNPYIAWALILGPLTLRAWKQSPANAMALVVAFYPTMVLGTVAMVVLFAAARSGGVRLARALVGVSAIALAGFGVYQLWSGVTALLQGQGA